MTIPREGQPARGLADLLHDCPDAIGVDRDDDVRPAATIIRSLNGAGQRDLVTARAGHLMELAHTTPAIWWDRPEVRTQVARIFHAVSELRQLHNEENVR